MAGRPLLVLARRGDDWAEALVRRLAQHGALLMSPEDLSVAGWCYRVAAPEESVAVVGGQRIRGGDLGGVVVRLPWVDPIDVPHIAPRDQAYVATEMSAFLVAWLRALPCPVLNRPSPGCLTGPGWRPEEWLARASRLGIPVLARRDGLPGAAAAGDVALTLIGARHLGETHPRVLAGAKRLAEAAGVALLCLRYAGSGEEARLTGAAVWPERPDAALPAAIVSYFYPARRRARIAARP